MKLNGLEQYFKTNENGEIVDFVQVNQYNQTPLIYALKNNRFLEFNLTNKQIDYLLKNSDLKKIDEHGEIALMTALHNNQSEIINLNKKQWNYLLKNSNVKNIDKYGWSVLMEALEFNQTEHNLNKEQWKYLIEYSDISLITDKEQLIELKKIQSGLLNDEILSKIEIKEEIKKNNKI